MVARKRRGEERGGEERGEESGVADDGQVGSPMEACPNAGRGWRRQEQREAHGGGESGARAETDGG
jgi:hypothetical protein